MTRRTRLSLALVAAAFLGLLSGCSDDDNPTIPNVVTNQADADDVALQAGMAFQNLSTVVEANIGAPGGPIELRTGARSDGGGFVTLTDTTFVRGTITFQVSRRWFGVNGVEQTAADATTDSLVLGTRVYGTDSTTFAPRYRVTVGHSGQLRIGGLVQSRPIGTIAGAAADTLDSRFTTLSGGTHTFYSYVVGVASGIEIVKTAGTGYPTKGTIRWVIHAQRTRNGDRGSVEKTLDATVTLTFNGTRHPTLTVNGTWGYVLDLVTGAVTRGGSA